MSDDLHWLDRLLEVQTRGVQALELRVREVGRTVDAVAKRADEATRTYEDATEQRASRPVVDHDRVVQVVRSGHIAELSSREARYASILFDVFAAEEILPLLQARPRGWRHLITRCMREWDRFARLSGRNDYTVMLRQAPSDALRARIGLDAAALLGEGGLSLVGRKLQPIADGRALVRAIVDAGFSWRWELTAHVVEQWFLNRRSAWAATLPSVLEVEELRWILLPSEASDNDSRVRSTLDVRSRVVAALIEDGVAGALPRAVFDDLTTRLLKSKFGDPRIPPLSEGWLGVRERQPRAFGTFLQALVRNDLRFFFELVQGDADRLAFWEGYLPRIQGAFCVLDPSAHDRVRHALRASEDAGAASALARAKRARRGAQNVQAFCLFFQDFVVVEFSVTGNAAYIYPRAVFERDILPTVHSGLSETTQLKRPLLPHERIRHHQGWQREARGQIGSWETSARGGQ